MYLVKIILTLLSLLQKTSSVKCFKCLGNGHIAPNVLTKGLWLCWVMGYLLVLVIRVKVCLRRLMGSVFKDRDETQRENVFHTMCMVIGKICSLIINGGSCTNVASQRLIENLALKTSPHHRPYKLQ